MRRVIKFRAWTEENMLYSREYEKMASFFDAVERNSYPLQQFTGLLDKNGVEIYEGDIVKLDHWEPSIYQISFARGAFYVAEADGEEAGDIKYAERSKVIGNIYENPELLAINL